MDDASVVIASTNEFDPIPEMTTYPWTTTNVVHAVLGVVTNNKDVIEFGVTYVGNLPPVATPEEMDAYAVKVATGAPFLPGERAKTPYDIKVYSQTWLLIQLDPTIKNWQFAKDSPGCTTKDIGNDHNFRLRYAYPDGSIGYRQVNAEGCQVMYFGVAHREYKNALAIPDPSSQFFNFHVEFLQEIDPATGVPGRRLPIIFDPDVKNEGPTEFP